MFRCRGSNSGAPNLQSGLIHYGIYYALHYAPNKAERQQILLVPSKVGQARVGIQHDNLLLFVSVCLVIYFFLVECLCYKYIILKPKGYYLLVNTCALLPPYRYKIFGKALTRIQSDSQVFGDHVILLQVVLLSLSNCFYLFCQVTSRIGHPITGYGQETRNRAARQRIPSKIWTDEDGVEHVEVAYTLVSATVSASIVPFTCTGILSPNLERDNFTGYNCAVCCASFLGNCSGNSLVPQQHLTMGQ